ncbi:MAG TPA: hypothetical protein VH054_22785 [Polyangiaceae bacterium]|jgi:hypothetical protein|nr:hypothetical protein [Polyangiaceae bacterium]
MRKLAALVFLVACSRESTTNVVVLQPPSAAPVASSAPIVAAAKPAVELAVIGGDLVDLGAMKVVHSLTTDMVFASSVGGDTAYLYARLAAGGSELRAYDATSGALRWSKPAVECWNIAASSAGVFCGDSAGVHFFRRAGGADKTVSLGAVSSITRLAGRVLALADTKLEAFDDSGASLGKTTTPVPADRNYRQSLDVGGALACATRRSDVDTTVFCVDASPRVVWSRVVPVPGGLLRQVDADVTVVTSDLWSKTPESEVVRTSDGVALLHVAGVRFAAALSTRGTFDAALTCAPDVALYDAKGTKKWTAKGAPFHDEALRATRAGSAIVGAQYSPIATGTQLRAWDEASGALVWTGNVDSLPISHSKYSNEVTLENRGKSILLIGHESSQVYAQTFDDATGVRIASIVRPR